MRPPSLYAPKHKTGLHMRILIYLLAMLTGFSAAEAARPVAAVPASVDAAVAQNYASAIVRAAPQNQVLRLSSSPSSITLSDEWPAVPLFSSVAPTTPVMRYDVILG
jgi:hypothetical protein